MSKTKNDRAWEKLFDKYQILENVQKNGLFQIHSSSINKFREARLMTKFDHKSQLPKIFVKNSLSILPISRGEYIIGDFEIFHEIESSDTEIIRIEFPNFIESIDYDNITSESTALNCAYVSGMIQEFVKDEELKPTVNGRMSSSMFDFCINTHTERINISVNNSQIEIDGGYEGIDSLVLIEAKNSISNDFLIRQLYYPFKLWSNKIDKRVRPIFFTYSNGIFHFREYTFEDPCHYNSLRLCQEQKYSIRGSVINNELIQTILVQAKIVPEPRIPFPQADSFHRIINLCELLNENTGLTRGDITENYDFNVRQTNYYTDAGRYLGIIDKKRKNGGINYFLTGNGQKLFNLSLSKRQERFIELILSHMAFNQTLKLYFEKSEVPTKNEIVGIMRNSKLFNVHSESTFERRASTVLGWINWILEQIDE